MLNTRIDRNTTCNFCGTNIRVTPDSVKRVYMPLELNEMGENLSEDPMLILTVFTCKICGNSTVKTVDDIISQDILKQCLKTQLKGEKLKSKGMCLNGADLKKLSKLNRKLDNIGSSSLYRCIHGAALRKRPLAPVIRINIGKIPSPAKCSLCVFLPVRIGLHFFLPYRQRRIPGLQA